jgi:hypothetical protein
MFPKGVALLTGFPPARIEESEQPIGEVYQDKQFIVYVEVTAA